MSNKEERYLNVTLKNEEEKKDEVVISFSSIFKKLKRYFIIWVAAAVVLALLTFVFTAVFSNVKQENSISAMISFTYDGIEEGLDPNGNDFDVNSLKNPAVIEAALTELNQPLKYIEAIRQNITIEGELPHDAIDKIRTYKSVYEESGNLAAAQSMLDVEYYPTMFTVTFNYAKAGFNNSTAVQVFNMILECYRDYFFETYGYNQALGSAVSALDYRDYDYAEAIDVFDTTLSTLENYVNNLSKEDTTRFRSSETGYSFSDLYQAINTLRTIDLDILSSYITVNNVTKDKDNLITYYQYRIDELGRQKIIAQESLASLTDSIESYQKDTMIVYGNNAEGVDTDYTLASEQYDNLIQQKQDAQTTLSTATQQIAYYEQRVKALDGKSAADNTKTEKVENDLSSLNVKINKLLDDINKTADEYYETVSFANSYNILVPASSSAIKNTMRLSIEHAKMPIIVLEVLLLVIYIGFAFVTSIIDENKKNKDVISAEENDEENNEK